MRLLRETDRIQQKIEYDYRNNVNEMRRRLNKWMLGFCCITKKMDLTIKQQQYYLRTHNFPPYPNIRNWKIKNKREKNYLRMEWCRLFARERMEDKGLGFSFWILCCSFLRVFLILFFLVLPKDLNCQNNWPKVSRSFAQ